jgi:hypothetical protein
VWSIQLQLLKIGPYIHITGMELAVFKHDILSTVIYIWLYAEKSSDFCCVLESTVKIIIEFISLSTVDQHSQNV